MNSVVMLAANCSRMTSFTDSDKAGFYIHFLPPHDLYEN